MPSSVGPNTFGEENLVFGYDLGDVRNSYKGEPTTNFMPNIYRDGSNIIVGTDSIGNYFQGTITRIGCPNGTSINSGSTYTFTIELRSDTTFNMSADSNQYAPENGGNDNNRVSVSYIIPNYTTPGKWVKYSTTVVMKSGLTNPTMFDFFMPQSFTGRLYYRNAQLEYKPHATQFTPSGTTRSATQGLLDLTGNSTVDLSNVSFDSNAQMTFDGSNDYATLSSASHPTGSCSMEIVFNHTHNFVGSRYLLYGANGTAFWVFFRGDWAGNLLYFTRRVTNSGNYGDSAWGYTTGIYQPVPANETMHLIFTHDASSGEFKCYKNGILTRTVNGNLAAYGALNTTQQSHYIGGSPGDNLPMTLPLFKFYDRVLTASEIQSNFNAIKGRFNI
jgi:hypothetical protein